VVPPPAAPAGSMPPPPPRFPGSVYKSLTPCAVAAVLCCAMLL
jgi:hypothetical protein